MPEIRLKYSSLSPEKVKMVQRLFFSTKKDTAEHYPVYLYFEDLSSWWAPRSPLGMTKDFLGSIIGTLRE